jgi:hypothetical protein
MSQPMSTLCNLMDIRGGLLETPMMRYERYCTESSLNNLALLRPSIALSANMASSTDFVRSQRRDGIILFSCGDIRCKKVL